MASDPPPSASSSQDEIQQGGHSWWARLAEWNPSLLTTVTLAVATGLRMALTPLWGSGYTFITYYPAIMFIAVANGWRHGVAATLVSSVLTIVLFFDMQASPGEQQTALALFITANVIIVSLSEAVTRARLRAQAETSLVRAQEQRLRLEIDARAKAEETVRASERQMQFVTDHAPVLIAQCGTDGRYRFVNQRYADLVRRTPEDLIGLHPREVLGAEAYQQAEPYMREALAGRQVKFDQQFLGAASMGRLLQVTYAPEWDERGIVTGFIAAIVDITERKQAEQARATLAAIVESSEDAIVSKDLNGLITSWNRGAERLYGYTRQEAVGQSVLLVIPDEQIEEETPILAKIVRGETVQQYETIRRRKDGTLIDIALTVSAIRNDEGRIVGVSKVAHDITERKRAEAALRESEERLRLFIEHAPAAIAMFDRQMRYVAVSRRWLADYGLEGEVLGRSHYEIFPDIPERWRRAHQEGLAGVVMRIEEDRFERSDGTVYWLRWEVRPWRDKAGGIGGIIIFAEDITDSKKAEDALRESEAQHRATFDNAAVGIAHVGLDGRWLRCNDALCALTGYSREELLARTFTEITHPDDIEGDWASVRRLLAGEIETFSMEKRYIRKDGSLIWGHLTVSLLRDEQGSAHHFISIIQDIQIRKEAQAQLRQLADDLEQRVEVRTRELADTQDKLRALTTELNLTEHRIRKQLATDLHDYLAQLLVLSRIKLGQAKLEEVTPAAMEAMTEVQEVMDRALAYTRTLVAQLSPPILNEFGLLMALRWLADQMQRELTVKLDLESDVLSLSEEQSVLLFQSVRELLMNIVKHAGTTEAKISVTQADGVLRICVSDRGVGCDVGPGEAKLEPGFGLFSIRERMKALGGEFDMQSVPGEGTTAILQLPVVQPGPTADEAVAETGVAAVSHAVVSEPAAPGVPKLPTTASLLATPKIRVLLVDDHRMLRQGLRTIVNGHPGLEVVGEARDGLEAIELTRTLSPAVVVMDVNMPRCDGVVATKRIKEEYPEIKIVALSMHNSPDIVARMKQAGAYGYLTKESAGVQLCRAIVEAALSRPSGASGEGRDVSCGPS
ncbi:MAG TPA: PAS domain S-box protein [Nitrospira sp.]|nr:PAS domain S-box protein [Nitrospira sp.]